ncbi:hypothetical protein DES36_10165 [Alkalibaculum bacchi]|uniref:Uncharacterized protein n=2 Tax=Alkalibaculum bacchi TaxID=645887 RepID=A0A366IHM5_9FIRM|nr:hypothetical protein DES36_10165 [Alkalibaculum bacchi]
MKKKFLLLITMACFIFSFSACTTQEEPIEEQNQPIEEQQQVDPGNDGDINDDNLENDVIDDGENVGDEMNDAVEDAGDTMDEAGNEVNDAVTNDNNNQ